MRLKLSSLTFSDGTVVPLEPGETVFLVGPNNSGKSATLKEVDRLLQNQRNHKKVIQELKYETPGSMEDLLTRICRDYRTLVNQQDGTRAFAIGEARIPESTLQRTVHQIPSHGLQALKHLFVQFLSTQNRLTAADPVERVDYERQGPTHPIHELEINDALEERVNQHFKKAFNTSLTVHRSAGKHLPLVVGERPLPEEGEDRLSHNYLNKISALPHLELQGDGMRSFVSIVLNTQIKSKDLVLIDEPEAFLHPIQVRMLGGILCNRTLSDSQALISTHSGELLRSAITQPDGKVKVIRIQRVSDVNHISLLKSEDLNALWEDPLLRQSNVLDGIFHQGVIVCEADPDCRFYSAVLEEVCKSQPKYPDIMFTHCGGKDRMNVAVDALRALDVPVKSICDIDLIRDKGTARKLFEAHGGDWSDVSRQWDTLQAAVRDLQAEIPRNSAKDRIMEIFDQAEHEALTRSDVKQIQEVLKRASPWKTIKSAGKSVIPSGGAYAAFEEIIRKFSEVGIHVLEVGELEGFVRDVGGHGPKWVNAVLEQYSLEDQVLQQARDFVHEVCHQFL
ncbi:AAA family ATPase [Marinobacter salarius]|uniref:ATP-dependent nuclease n=1 Tax=Marinobacter salarius TaxID=1420917 RepID=UPI00273B0007|nr:AAA family ATPase [Marinobacter salarius]MDP4532520.1 AAA family ATPase [Marinobacter salarius]